MQVALALHVYSKFMQDIIRGQRRRITTPSVSKRQGCTASFMKPLSMIYGRMSARYCFSDHFVCTHRVFVMATVVNISFY